MKSKNILWAAVVVVAALAVWYFAKPSKQASNPPGQNNGQTNQNSNSAGQPATQVSGNTISGVLKASDTPSRGNLMLVTDTQTVYIHTSRDYSGLLGKQVTVTYDGTLINFKLLDISAK